MNKKNKNHNTKRRVIALLTREQIEFIDNMGMDALFSTGVKLSRVEVIAALVDAAKLLGIKAKGIKNKQALVHRIIAATHAKAKKFEKRKFLRLDKHLSVKLRNMDSLGEFTGSFTQDVGLGGFRIEACFLDSPPKINQVIEISICDPHKENSQAIKAIGRIAWVRENKTEHSHELGVMLTYMKEEDREKFEKYLSKDKEIEINKPKIEKIRINNENI